MTNPRHKKWMKWALQLAEKGRFTVSPNPMVGACVIRHGRLAGQGYHRQYGGDHAEVVALRQAGRKANGATLYVTLEPCSTWGKTPPCVSTVLRAGIRHVVIGSTDPNPIHHKIGIAALKREGVRVTSGVLMQEVKKQNEAFFKYTQKKLPFVTLKMAQSLDGKIATSQGRSRWITSEPARHFVHRLRAGHDAVMVGKNTLLTDDPFLSPRLGLRDMSPEKPWRIVLAPRLEIPKNARIFKGEQLTLVAVSEKKQEALKKQNKLRSVTLLSIGEKEGRLDMRDLLAQLANLGVATLLVEGGGELAWSLIEANLVDRLLWIVAPKIIGGRSAKTSVEGKGINDLSKAYFVRDVNVSRLGEDWLFEGRL
ncbi:MAG TPA: bifunctional diaminohydroxyphosphoribosylaminopyrimidine deaminase/5-amino-6-(5-phosphoribosylamino)uracil reductase RibD [bacterium]|nr:bifunctional diaminohydroxyphosphoribosylaminopyrimidine deaminase/5-amino-6-(5-phosphoribosylamino)uracil reductase RibD [bacterium]